MSKRKVPPVVVPPDLLQAARRCTPMMRTFAERLAVDPERNLTRAAKASGAKNPRVLGQRWSKNQKVQAYVAGLIEAATPPAPPPPPLPPTPEDKGLVVRSRDAAMEVQEVLERISEHARVDMADFISVADPVLLGGDTLRPASLHSAVYFDWGKALANGKTHLIKEITWNKHGFPCVKLIDSQGALRTLAQIRGLLHEPEKSEDATKMASAIAALAALPPEVLRQVHRAFLSQGEVAAINVSARRLPEPAHAG